MNIDKIIKYLIDHNDNLINFSKDIYPPNCCQAVLYVLELTKDFKSIQPNDCLKILSKNTKTGPEICFKDDKIC